MAQICKKCLLREMAEADAKMIEKYKEAIKKEDQVSESEYAAPFQDRRQPLRF